MIHICQIQLSKTFDAAKTIKSFGNEKQQKFIFDCQIIVFLIIYDKAETTFFLINKH